MQWKGSFCAQSAPAVVVARTPQDWSKVWRMIGKPAPQADLESHFGVAVFLGEKPTGGYSVAWQAQGQDGVTLVRYRVEKPKGMAIQALTRPYDVRLFPTKGGPVKVEALPGD